MPEVYACKKCGLIFEVGWYHYHEFESGYAAETVLVCRECGTVHAVEHAVTPRQVPDLEGKLPPDQGPIWRPDRVLQPFIGMEGIADELALGAVRCGHCVAVGSLLDRWPDEGAPCPECGAPIRGIVSSWIT